MSKWLGRGLISRRCYDCQQRPLVLVTKANRSKPSPRWTRTRRAAVRPEAAPGPCCDPCGWPFGKLPLLLDNIYTAGRQWTVHSVMHAASSGPLRHLFTWTRVIPGKRFHVMTPRHHSHLICVTFKPPLPPPPGGNSSSTWLMSAATASPGWLNTRDPQIIVCLTRERDNRLLWLFRLLSESGWQLNVCQLQPTEVSSTVYSVSDVHTV